MEAEAALQICSITTGARIFSAQLRPSQGRTHPQRAGLTTHIPHWTSFFALQIFFPRILRFPPTRPVPAAVTDVSRVYWCKSDAGKPQKSAWVCFALVCGAFFALAARGSHWIERKEEVKCNKCPEFFLSAVIEKSSVRNGPVLPAACDHAFADAPIQCRTVEEHEAPTCLFVICFGHGANIRRPRRWQPPKNAPA